MDLLANSSLKLDKENLSHYLFILCMEALSRLLADVETKGNINGIKIWKNSLPIFHLLFADGCLIFMNSNQEELVALFENSTQVHPYS